MGAGVAVWKTFRFEEFIGKVGAGDEGEFFGEDKGVVAVEEELCDLGTWLSALTAAGVDGGDNHLRHDGQKFLLNPKRMGLGVLN